MIFGWLQHGKALSVNGIVCFLLICRYGGYRNRRMHMTAMYTNVLCKMGNFYRIHNIAFQPTIDLQDSIHDVVMKSKHFPRNWPFVRGIHWSSMSFPHKGQWRWALVFSLVCAWINGWVNDREAGDLRRHCAHHDVIVMYSEYPRVSCWLLRSGMWYPMQLSRFVCQHKWRVLNSGLLRGVEGHWLPNWYVQGKNWICPSIIIGRLRPESCVIEVAAENRHSNLNIVYLISNN